MIVESLENKIKRKKKMSDSPLPLPTIPRRGLSFHLACFLYFHCPNKKQCIKQCIKRQRHHFANKGPSSQSYGFSTSHVQV